jgi:hypothetical protein
MTTWPVYVSTKARAGRPRTARLLAGSGVPWTAVVEPQDEPAYRAALGPGADLLVLPDDDRGLPYARQAALDHARAAGHAWFWQLDDDIDRFYSVAAGRCTPCPAGAALAGAQAALARVPRLAVGALEYQQFAWRARGPYALGSYCDVAVCLDARNRRLRYREEQFFKGDRDLCLAALAAGYATARTTRWAFAAPKNGSNPGGLAAEYARAGREAEASRRLCARWGPAICRPLTKPDGRPDVKIDWSYFRRAAAAGPAG